MLCTLTSTKPEAAKPASEAFERLWDAGMRLSAAMAAGARDSASSAEHTGVCSGCGSLPMHEKYMTETGKPTDNGANTDVIPAKQRLDVTTTRRRMLQFSAGMLATSTGWCRTAIAQNPQFRDADRTRDKIVALVRPFGESKSVRPIQKIEPAVVTIPEMKVRSEDLPLVDYFVGDLQLRYSFDDPKLVSSVSLGDLKRLKLTRDELLTLCVADFLLVLSIFELLCMLLHVA